MWRKGWLKNQGSIEVFPRHSLLSLKLVPMATCSASHSGMGVNDLFRLGIAAARRPCLQNDTFLRTPAKGFEKDEGAEGPDRPAPPCAWSGG